MARSRNSPKPELPTVFTDRCLGNSTVPDGLRAAGFEVLTMHEVYGDDTAQALEDPQWIREMTRRKLVLFSKDARIKTVHRDAVIAARAKVFLLPDQSMRGNHMVERYAAHKYRIAARSLKDGPHIYMVQPKALEHYKMAG